MSDEIKTSLAEHIAHLVANPPPKRISATETRDRDPTRAMDHSAVNALRTLACKQTGLSMTQLLEEEKNINWPKEFIPTVLPHRQLARRRMEVAKVPELFIRCVADEPPVDCDAMKEVKAFLESKKGFLVLSGGKGTRKTGSAAWALGQLDGGSFVEASEITGISIEEKERWKKITTSKLIVLDDLGVEKTDGKGAFIDAFNTLFNGVYSNCRRLIITCNLRRDQFATEPERGGYGGRTYDRLRESGTWVVVGGESVRGYVREPGEDDD